ncbi:g5878 [Coccomyxa viridis]|uniref:RING-type E3 ubiquitin transferase n=1 Tax=Coccomyxa viridis TaxID=1274662 RepID=A0ABP1FU02_9CHLO
MSKKAKCELCNHPFSFTKVYAQNAPSKLPFREFAWGLTVRASHSVRFGLRVLVVTFTWLFVAPTLTCWLWRLAFVRSFQQGVSAIAQRFEPVLILADCIQGIVISCCLICAVLFCSAAWDYILQYWAAFAPHVLPPLDRPEEIEAAQAPQLAQPAVEESGADAASASHQQPAAQQPAHSGGPAVLDESMPGSSGAQQQTDSNAGGESSNGTSHENGPDTAAEAHGRPDENGPEAADLQRAARRRRDRQRVQAAAPREDNREVDFDALLGLEGPLIGLFENAAMIVLLAALMLFTAFWLPFTVGRCVLSAMAGLQLDHASLVMKAMQLRSTMRPQAMNQASAEALGASMEQDTAGFAAAVMVLERIFAELEAHLTQPSVTDWAVLMVGYVVLGCLAMAGLWLYLAWRMVRSRRRGRGLAWAKHALSMAGRQFRAHLIRMGFGAKVVCMLMTELVLLPIAHGYFVHICAWPLVHSRPAIHFGISFVLLHWLMGMGFLMATAGFLSISRSILRPEALPFLRDPYAYEEEEPFGQMMTAPIRDQMYKAVTGFAIMACLAVACIHVPVHLAKALSPSLFPLHLKLMDALAELPADLLLFHVCLPLTLPYLNIRAVVRRAVQWWLAQAAALLGLEDYLLRRAGQPGPAQAQGQQALLPTLIGEGGVVQGSNELAQGAQGIGLEGKLMVLLGMLIVTMISLITAGLLLPVHTGRLLLSLLHVPLRHDMYVAAAGCYALWALARLIGWARSVVMSPSIAGVLQKLGRGIWTCVGAVMLVVTALGLLSLMTGVLADLVLAPFRLPGRSTPVLLMQQDWALGMVSLKFVHHTMAGIPDRRLLRRPHFATFQAYVWPPLQLIAALLAVPFVVTRGILPHCGLPTSVLQVCWTWCWFAELAAVALFLLYRIGAVKVRELRRDLHEEKYLVGRQLNNLIRSHAISAPVGGEPRPTPDVSADMHAPASNP